AVDATTASTPAVTPAATEAPVTTMATARPRERGRDDTRARSAQEAKAKDTYYRDEYGWVMSDADVAAEQGIKAKYQTASEDLGGQIVKAEADYTTALDTGKNSINSAYDTAIAQAKMPTIADFQTETVTNNATGQEFIVPKGFKAATSNVKVSSKEEVQALFEAGAAQVTTALNNASQTYSASVANANTERQAQLDKFVSDSSKIYAANKATWDAQLQQLQSGYSNRVADGKAQYETKKKQYNDSITGMSEVGLLG
ncbi:MAG: hypothetical protein JZU65_16125, partial [Chlorobium sp.]|nr:hypothetical protein [Chlorobium sp.]